MIWQSYHDDNSNIDSNHNHSVHNREELGQLDLGVLLGEAAGSNKDSNDDSVEDKGLLSAQSKR